MNCAVAVAEEKIRVVLADDARHLLELEKSFFPETEFEVALARDGCEAYHLVKTIEPAVVFLDLFMPRLNGEECCRLIKSDPRLINTRVVLVTPDKEQLLRCCRDAPCDLVLTKPVRRRSFISAVQALVKTLQRVPARWPVRVPAELYDGNRCCLRTWTVNLSENGTYLESDEMFSLASTYVLALKMTDSEQLSLPARIAWLNPGTAPRDCRLPPGFGLRFIDLKGETRARLRKLLGETADPANTVRGSRQGMTRMFIELPMLTGKKV